MKLISGFIIVVVSFLFIQSVEGCPYLKGQSIPPDLNALSNLKIKRQLQAVPSQCPLLEVGEQLIPTKAGMCFVLSVLKPDFESIIADADLLKKSSIFGAALRSVFHDAGEIDVSKPEDMMGPDGCLSDGTDSIGLIEFESPVFTVIEQLWLKWCDKISRADFWVLFAKLVVQVSDPTGLFPFEFEFGRVDTHDCNAGSGRLPLANFGLAESERVFVHQMGLTIDDSGEWMLYRVERFVLIHVFLLSTTIVILMGAHTVGHANITNSGYGFLGDTSDGLLNAWDDTPGSFDNHYFSNLMNRVRELMMSSAQSFVD
jgi:hypothetical protein